MRCENIVRRLQAIADDTARKHGADTAELAERNLLSDGEFELLREACGRADARAQWDELVSVVMGD